MGLSVLILSLTLIFILNRQPTTSRQADEALKTRASLFAWPLLYFLTNTNIKIPKEYPDSAVKYLRDPPHNWYIAPREKDIQELKELFDTFNNSDNKVRVVHIYGIPGSGKTELARQFANSIFCKRNGSSTILTLNTESPKQFRNSLIISIGKIKKSGHTELKYDAKSETWVLANQLKHLLKKRPGWLLIVDNIRDPSITRKDMYKLLPAPGTNEWGTGKMLVTTQIPLPSGLGVRVKHNKGLTLKDATHLLYNVVKQKTNRSCDVKVAEEIVKVLEYLPLTILAAADYISGKISFNPSYSCRDYLAEHDYVATNVLPAHDKHTSNTYGYPHSMLGALKQTIEETRKVYSNVFGDFIALIGFTSRYEKDTSSRLVQNYLIMRGHQHAFVLLINFPLVYLSQQRFHVHQVVRFAFRQALERSETDERLQYILRNISFYFTNQIMFTHDIAWGFGERKSNIYFENERHFSALVQNLPTRYPHLSDCLIAPEWRSEDVEAVSSLIFKTYYQRYSWENMTLKLNCSKLDTFLFQLAHSPHYINRVAVQIRFKGFQALYICLRKVDKINGSFLAATAASQLIREVAPERSEMHTVPVSWVLLSLSLEVEYFEEILLYKNAFRFLPFPPDLNASKIRYKSCSFLHNVTKILSWNLRLQEKVITLCIPDLNNSTVMSQMIALISSVYVAKGPLAVNDILPLMLNFHIPLGRSYPITLLNGSGVENNTDKISPHGACFEGKIKLSLPDIETGGILKFYIDCDKCVGLERVEIVLRKYSGVILFLNMMRDMAVKSTLGEIDCRPTKNQLKALHEQELKMQNSIGPIMKSFYKDLLQFADNYCDILLKNLKPYTLSCWDNNYEYHLILRLKYSLDEFLRDKEFQQDQTKEITEMVKEIIASTKHDLSNENFQFGIELIPSGRVEAKDPELIQGLLGYG